MEAAVPRPCYGELLAVICIGAGHVIVELAISLDAARIYNTVALSLGAAYLVWRAATTKGLLRQWGLRADNFRNALRCHSLFLAAATAGLVAWGAFSGRLVLSHTAWVVLLLYPFFGVAQQFILQNLIASNLSGLIRQPLLCAFVAALLFGLSHLPRTSLVIFAFIAGFFLTLGYRRQPNLWAVGMIHGYLAALLFYFVLGKDPGARILESVSKYL